MIKSYKEGNYIQYPCTDANEYQQLHQMCCLSFHRRNGLAEPSLRHPRPPHHPPPCTMHLPLPPHQIQTPLAAHPSSEVATHPSLPQTSLMRSWMIELSETVVSAVLCLSADHVQIYHCTLFTCSLLLFLHVCRVQNYI